MFNGFIPACAGNRRSLAWTSMNATVHPRVCGEQNITLGGASVNAGSSPRVRGTEAHHLAGCKHNRFIPACAGNRSSISASLCVMSVHPRVCGEQAAAVPDFRAARGSSPRVRGTERKLDYSTIDGRFIPACAGNSLPGTY